MEWQPIDGAPQGIECLYWHRIKACCFIGMRTSVDAVMHGDFAWSPLDTFSAWRLLPRAPR